MLYILLGIIVINSIACGYFYRKIIQNEKIIIMLYDRLYSYEEFYSNQKDKEGSDYGNI